MIRIRLASEVDRLSLERIAAEMGVVHEAGYFERCLSEQKEKKRAVFVAEMDGRLAGYAQLIWSPLYPPFRRLGIPEIQDLNVIPSLRRKGIGARLVEACENLAHETGKTDIGIGVGLYARYGAAQKLYVNKKYIPDGAGICYDDVPVNAGDMRPVDDLLTLKLVKSL